MKLKKVLVLLILMMMALIGFQCGKNKTAPDYLIGVWRTSHEKYADRFLEIERTTITFDIGEGKSNTHPIINVEIEKTPKEKGTLHTIYYKDGEGLKATFSFYYNPADQGQIRFKNQDHIVWRKGKK
jgi:hypothetical protein